ncbi:MAG TPA: M23 family metallopeptidase [Gaiellaceae bacterium]|nr:M23 family metallopeptidase [Gaiellaceae bacterium]
MCVFLAWTPAAYAWSWPVQGQVLRPFDYDESHPYAAGQHRGVDIEADSAGEVVAAPAAGTISFAGTVPTNGRSVTIETADGYSVTLTHLGSIGIVKGATVAEAGPIGTVGPSGTPELDGPYVHLGIRATADPNGYVDPLGLLPPAAGSGADDTGSTTSQPASTTASSAPPASKPAAPAARAPRAVTTDRSRVRPHEQRRAQEPSSDARTTRSHQRRVEAREDERPRTRQRASQPTSSIRRPVVEPAAPQPIGLGAGHATRPPMPVARPRHQPSTPVSRLVCNGAIALFALGAAFAAARRRRRMESRPASDAQVLHLARPASEQQRVSRAA